MRFSIITCTWNSEPYLAQSIDSVLRQNYPDIEYIFVDGGSTDGTLERIRRIERPYTLIENVRGGISHAMNEGIRAATGDIVAHLHSDDYYLHPDTLLRVARAFIETDAAWVIGQVSKDIEGRLSSPLKPRPSYSFGRLLSGRFFVPHPATFVKQQVFNELGMFNETLKYAMDWDLWFRIAQEHQPTILDEELTAFREHEGSLSSASAGSKLKARKEEFGIRMRYARQAPLHALVFLARYWVRTRRLRRDVGMPT